MNRSPLDRRRRPNPNTTTVLDENALRRSGWSATDGQQRQSQEAPPPPAVPSPASVSWSDRLSTPEELALIATATTSCNVINYAQGGGGGDPDEDEESSIDSSSLSSCDDASAGYRRGRSRGRTPLLVETEGDDYEEGEEGELEEIMLVETTPTTGDADYDDDDDYDKKKPRRSFRIFRFREKGGRKDVPRHRGKGRQQRPTVVREVVDVERYMASREMTKVQERWNAYTMIPSPVYCLYFLLAGLWVSQELVDQARQELSVRDQQQQDGGAFPPPSTSGFTGLANDVVGDAHGCLNDQSGGGGSIGNWWSLPSLWFNYTHLPALPPLPVLAVAVAILLHAPFSFLYHYRYAHSLPPGLARTTHWSRRADQAMIHVASAFMAYATSGSYDFFLANVLYNADCVYRLFQRKVQPRRNKIRITISCLAYTIPILRRGDLVVFSQLWLLLGVAGWLFGRYPIGGWSHAVFHLVMAMVPPLLMTAACELPASQEQMRVAAYCVALAERAATITTATAT